MIAVHVTGANDTAATLAQISKICKKWARKTINEGTKQILRTAKPRTAVRTKRLKKSLGRKVKTHRGSGTTYGLVGPRTGYAVAGDDPVKRAHFIEKGTRHAAARPFLRPSLEDYRTKFVDELGKDVNEGIESKDFTSEGDLSVIVDGG